MRAVSYPRPEEFSVVDLPDPPLLPDEVRVKNLAVGVCGTDYHLHLGENFPNYPLTPGHEIVSTVVELGRDVDSLVVGDVVAVDNVRYCRACERCSRGDFNYCLNRRSMGTKLPGSFAERSVTPAANCYPLRGIPIRQAVIAESTACVVHGVELLGLRPGATVLLAGAGPTGLILAQLLRHCGASQVVVAAPTTAKLELALRRGADHAVQVDRANFAASTQKLLELQPSGFDVTVDATGASSVIEALVPMTASGGTVMIYGMARQDALISLRPFEIFRRQLRILGSFAQTFDFARALDLIRARIVTSDGMITHRFGLDDYRQALDALKSPDCVKAVVEPNGPVL